MSTNTLVSDIIAEHDARQRTQQTRTPKEVHARMIEMTNAANGLRYEVARFGDIERQLKAVHEKMEPLVLKAKELNDLICERVSQASQPWANSGIHESEELVQKVQQLERENVALREQLADVSRVRYSLEDSLTRAHNEAEACWKDKERLDWLEECHGWPEYIDAEWHVVGEVFSSYRAAIDAARKEGQP
jgi:hypothetical protein